MIARLLLIVVTGIGLAACAQDRVVLLPNPDGSSSGAVAVLDAESGAEQAVISESNTEAKLGGGSVKTATLGAEAVGERYGGLIEGLPKAPSLYTLYFKEGTAEVTDASRLELATLLAEVNERSGAEVQVTGHTDTVGKAEDNDALSIRRAEEVAAMLVRVGLSEDLIVTAGRGERELVVETADSVDEPRNRRVVVTVR